MPFQPHCTEAIALKRLFPEVSDADSDPSGNNPGQAGQSDDASLASSEPDSSRPDSHISISDCSTNHSAHSSGVDSDLASDASGEESIVFEEAAVPEETGIDDFENYSSDE